MRKSNVLYYDITVWRDEVDHHSIWFHKGKPVDTRLPHTFPISSNLTVKTKDKAFRVARHIKYTWPGCIVQVMQVTYKGNERRIRDYFFTTLPDTEFLTWLRETRWYA